MANEDILPASLYRRRSAYRSLEHREYRLSDFEDQPTMPLSKPKHKVTTASIGAPMHIGRDSIPRSSASSGTDSSIYSQSSTSLDFPQYGGRLIDLKPLPFPPNNTKDLKEPSTKQKLWRYVAKKSDIHGGTERDRNGDALLDSKTQRSVLKKQQSKSTADLNKKNLQRSKNSRPLALPLAFSNIDKADDEYFRKGGNFFEVPTRFGSQVQKKLDDLEPLTPLESIHEPGRPFPERIYFTPESIGWDIDLNTTTDLYCGSNGSLVSLSAIWDDDDFRDGGDWSGSKRCDNDQIDLIIPRRRF